MLSVLHPWYEAKLFVERATSIEHGTLHLVVGALVWLGLVMVFRCRVTSPGPWLAVLALAVWNEVIDIGIERWPHPGMQYGEGAADLVLTMLMPTVILLAVRYRPEIFAPEIASSTIPAPPDLDGEGGKADGRRA